MAQHKFRLRDTVWLPCEVRSGPFSNERRVYLKFGDDEWFGFVNVTELEQKVLEGADRVKAVVIGTGPKGGVLLSVRGQSPASGPIHTDYPSLMAEHGAVTT